MAGGMFAEHDQCGGDIIQRNGRKFKLFYGMSSAMAMEKHTGRVAEYRYSHLIVHVSKPAGLAHECLKYVES
jgi:IMP dehydrogenase/GMP reductase